MPRYVSPLFPPTMTSRHRDCWSVPYGGLPQCCSHAARRNGFRLPNVCPSGPVFCNAVCDIKPTTFKAVLLFGSVVAGYLCYLLVVDVLPFVPACRVACKTTHVDGYVLLTGLVCFRWVAARDGRAFSVPSYFSGTLRSYQRKKLCFSACGIRLRYMVGAGGAQVPFCAQRPRDARAQTLVLNIVRATLYGAERIPVPR